MDKTTIQFFKSTLFSLSFIESQLCHILTSVSQSFDSSTCLVLRLTVCNQTIYLIKYYIFLTKTPLVFYFVSLAKAIDLGEDVKELLVLRILALRFLNENVCISMNAIVNLDLIYP